MSKLCERPGCSEPGAAAYGMVPEDLLFWISSLPEASGADPPVLCKRHADAMVVPRGWTLDDRREAQPRLFKPRPSPVGAPAAPSPRRRRHHAPSEGEQLQIDGTGEIPRPTLPTNVARGGDVEPVDVAPWSPEFDENDDLDGLLEVSSPLLARAFRGTDRRRA